MVPSPLILPNQKGKQYFGHRRYLLTGEAERLDPKDATHREHPHEARKQGKLSEDGLPYFDSSHLALLMITVICSIRHNHMVEEVDSHHLTGSADGLGQFIVSSAW